MNDQQLRRRKEWTKINTTVQTWCHVDDAKTCRDGAKMSSVEHTGAAQHCQQLPSDVPKKCFDSDLPQHTSFDSANTRHQFIKQLTNVLLFGTSSSVNTMSTIKAMGNGQWLMDNV